MEYDVIIIGAGAVGCACARELSRYRLSIAVLEKNSDVAGETTGRNSAVVHAGFNNRPGSRMASLCVEGNEGFADLAQKLDVPFRETGKLLLAFDDEDVQTLEHLLAQGRMNGCRDLEILEGRRLEQLLEERGMGSIGGAAAGRSGPAKALWSPHTGITNPFLYCAALAENARANGAQFYLDTEVTGIRRAGAREHEPEGQRFRIEAGGRNFGCRYLINAAGLQADRIAAMAGADRYHIYPCRGEYFILDKSELAMPVYPAPRKKAGGLGVHLTPTSDGNIIIGPSAEYLDIRDDYACTRPVMEELMRQAVQLVPAVRDMQPIGNYSGIRPKLAPPEEGGYQDFVIRAEEDVLGLIDLVGIESPGLTASVPIARQVCRMIEQMERAGAAGRSSRGLRRKNDFEESRRGILRFREQSPQRQAELIREDPEYGEIICRCQKITKREIRQAIENPLGARSIAAIKYRAWATTGRCNGGYCLPRITEMLVREYGVKPEEIRYRNSGSEMFAGRVK
ncbi:MAG: NAD(P)/FAD-dependent oxidoreductase [Firmicutes bacterium]|nr:NAD(P)/FAD-dependent oxidoreductase [Bacillota bacterium]